jgi:hypothetical protein
VPLVHAVREDELPRNVARNVELSVGPKPEFEPLTAEEGRQLLTAARENRLWVACEPPVRIGLRRTELRSWKPSATARSGWPWACVPVAV